ncbi:NADase-type glycan-binding domain-containing protein [Saccharothrix coeruleofusca]|uniref:NADase-type glycan-binding domain-containing protein n=1 Tax=Saccharothrix coeruleofusca TaxID=33919 RepID=UPI00166F74C2|nr:zinc-ribbon domain-containing protein [Saccharothrix coeruleofusca]
MSARSCPQCGAPVAPTDDFCGNCGNYLGWAADPGRTAGSGSATRDGAAVPPERTAGRVDAVPREADDAAHQARSTPVPPAPMPPVRTSPGEPPPAARLGPVLPGRPEAKRPLPTAAAEAAVHGPPCPNCGTANPPGRRFCRRCATPLHQGQRPAGGPRRRRWRWRGDRSRWLRRLAALLVVAALVAALWVFHPRLLALWEDLRDRIANPAPVAPTSTTASAAVPDHPAAAAADGLSNRYWGAPAVGDSVDFGFDEPFRLLSVVVHAGASAEEEGFVAQARPSSLELVVTTADGGTRTLPVTLADQPGPQRTDTGISDVVRVRVVVRSATGLAPGGHIALGEVEFFRRP